MLTNSSLKLPSNSKVSDMISVVTFKDKNDSILTFLKFDLYNNLYVYIVCK